MKSVELRQHKRYRLTALVSFEWETNSGTVHKGEGQTRDISPAGVFVVTPQALPIGTAVRMEVALPGLQSDEGPRLKTQAHVIRSERGGFAAIADAGFRLQLQGIDSVRKGSKDESGVQSLRPALVHH